MRRVKLLVCWGIFSIVFSVIFACSLDRSEAAVANMDKNNISSTSSSTKNGETKESEEAANQNVSDYLGGYNFDSIDNAVNEYSDYDLSFKNIVSEVIGESSTNGNANGFVKALNIVFMNAIRSNKTAVLQIILLAVLSAMISCFGPDFNKGQVSDTAQMVISISLITILIAAFYSASTICSDAVEACISIYKSLIPIFFSAVTFASGSVTAGVYYEIVLIMIMVVNIVFKTILISLNKIYVLFSMADSVTGEERFSKAAEFVPTVIKWTCRTSIIIFTGLGGIKGMIAPVSDSMKKNLFFKAFQMIPGIGNSVETVSQTVIGAGTIVKNGIGSAAIIVLVVVCAVPIMKLVALTCLFKITAAAIETVADKRIVKAVNSISVAIGSLAVIVLVALSLFVLMAAIICISTNMNYIS